MNDTNHKPSALFTPSACLTEDALMAFVSGTLTGNDLALVRQHIATCPLCADSADGLRMWHDKTVAAPVSGQGATNGATVKSAGKTASTSIPQAKPKPGQGAAHREFQSRIETINERVRQRAHASGRAHGSDTRPIMYKPSVWLAAAATLILFVGVFYIVWKQNFSPEQKLAEKQLQEMASANAPANTESLIDSTAKASTLLSLNGKSKSPRKLESVTIQVNEDIYYQDSGSEEILSQMVLDENIQLEGETAVSEIASVALPGMPDTAPIPSPEEPAAVSGVVVTALGISRSKQSLGYATNDACDQAATGSYEMKKMQGRTIDGKSAGDEENPVFTIVEEMPSFPGGETARNRFLAENIVYPQQAVENGIQGIVYVSFIVDTKGNVTGAKVLRGIGGGCDEEALRVVKMMPKWLPGKQNGKQVRVLFNMPVAFRLQG
jgi:TonB family protein